MHTAVRKTVLPPMYKQPSLALVYFYTIGKNMQGWFYKTLKE